MSGGGLAGAETQSLASTSGAGDAVVAKDISHLVRKKVNDDLHRLATLVLTIACV